jgi:hypothetical protein
MEEGQLEGQLLAAPQRALGLEADVADLVVAEGSQLGRQIVGGGLLGLLGLLPGFLGHVFEVEGLCRRQCTRGQQSGGQTPQRRGWKLVGLHVRLSLQEPYQAKNPFKSTAYLSLPGFRPEMCRRLATGPRSGAPSR